MSKSRYQIEMDYQNAFRQAEQLDRVANDLQSSINSLKERKERLRACWSGDNANAYYAKLAASESRLVPLQKQISSAASTVRTIAQRTYDTEMASLEVFQRRTY